MTPSQSVEGTFLQRLYKITDDDLVSLFHKIDMYMTHNDTDALVAALACAVSTAAADKHALWLLLVGAPSGGKTESIRVVTKLADEKLADITLAGLLTQRPPSAKQIEAGLTRPPTGLLARLADRQDAFVTINDLSPLLTRGSGGPSSGAQQSGIFDALRCIHDGEYTRTMEAVAPSWRGRLTLLSAVTPEIDRFHTHANALGPRWVYWRLPTLDDEQSDDAFDLVDERENLDQHRDEASTLAKALVEAARLRLPAVRLADGTVAVTVQLVRGT